jgi:regulator of protease activity HflC (stomatin/prohibitin superfamily)
MRRSSRIDAAAIRDAARDAGVRTGVDVLDAYLKDVIVPAEIRTAAMQLVTAKSRGAAQLEDARAETAAMRALANAGKLLEAHPALAQLRLVQQVPYGFACRAGDGWRFRSWRLIRTNMRVRRRGGSPRRLPRRTPPRRRS